MNLELGKLNIEEYFNTRWQEHHKKALERFKHLHLDYPTGQIIAKATITNCVKVDDHLRSILIEKDPIVYKGLINKDDWDEYGFQLENVEKIDPIEINGKLSLWDYD